jgi:hypothetical protein
MKWLRIALEVIGVISLLMMAIGAAWFIHAITSTKANIDTAKRKDALFILNWGGIPTNQDFRILSSYRSSRNITGDHIDAYCIELSRFEIADYAKEQWQDGPEKNPLLAEALQLGANDAHEHASCFPSAKEADSEGMRIMFWSVVLHGRQPSAADIILYAPRSKMLYYVSYKT